MHRPRGSALKYGLHIKIESYHMRACCERVCVCACRHMHLTIIYITTIAAAASAKHMYMGIMKRTREWRGTSKDVTILFIKFD